MGQVTNAILTRSPLRSSASSEDSSKLSVRLACIRHAASVHPEPGSNSPQKKFLSSTFIDVSVFLLQCVEIDRFVFFRLLITLQLLRCYLVKDIPLPSDKNTDADVTIFVRNTG